MPSCQEFDKKILIFITAVIYMVEVKLMLAILAWNRDHKQRKATNRTLFAALECPGRGDS